MVIVVLTIDCWHVVLSEGPYWWNSCTVRARTRNSITVKENSGNADAIWRRCSSQTSRWVYFLSGLPGRSGKSRKYVYASIFCKPVSQWTGGRSDKMLYNYFNGRSEAIRNILIFTDNRFDRYISQFSRGMFKIH